MGKAIAITFLALLSVVLIVSLVMMVITTIDDVIITKAYRQISKRIQKEEHRHE